MTSPRNKVGYSSASFGWVNTNNNRDGNFQIEDDLDMRGYDLTATKDIQASGTISGDRVEVTAIKNTVQTDVLPVLSQTSQTFHVEETTTGGAVTIAANALVEGLLSFSTINVSSITWPDFNQVDAVLSDKNTGTSNKNSSFLTVLINRTSADIPAMTAGANHTFLSGAGLILKSEMAYVFRSYLSASSYDTMLLAQASAQSSGAFKMSNNLNVNDSLDADGSDLNIGSLASTNTVNIGRVSQSTVISSDDLRSNVVDANNSNLNIGTNPTTNTVNIGRVSQSTVISSDDLRSSVVDANNSNLNIGTNLTTNTINIGRASQSTVISSDDLRSSVVDANNSNLNIGTNLTTNTINIGRASQSTVISSDDLRSSVVDANNSNLNIGTNLTTNTVNIGRVGQDTVIASDTLKVDVVDANSTDLSIGTAATTNDIYIGRAGQNSIVNSDNLKVDSIVSTGSGNVTIEGTGLRAQGTTIEACFGDTTAAPPTSTVFMHLEGNSDTTFLAEANLDGNTSGDAQIALQTQANKFHSSLTQTQASPDLVIEAARESLETANDIVFKVGGSYVGAPALGVVAAPTGGTSALTLDGANANVTIANSLLFTGAVEIGDSSTSGNAASDVTIGKNCTSSTGVRSIGIGDGCVADGQDVVVIGSNTSSVFTDSVVIGPRATSTKKNIVIGPDSSSSGAAGVVLGDNSHANADGAYVIGNGITNTTANSFEMFANTDDGTIAGNLKHGGTNHVWTNIEGPFVECTTLYANNAASYTAAASDIVNAIVRNAYNSGTFTLTFPSFASISTFLENSEENAISLGSATRHTMFMTTLINATGQTVTLTAGTNQTIVGTSFSAGVSANESVSFISYMTASAYVTTRISTQAI
jgi:hypothetical protein